MENKIKTLKTELGLYTDNLYTLCDADECKEYNKLLEKGLPLPDDIIYSEEDKNFYKFTKSASYEYEIQYINLLNAKNINTIKNCVVFLQF